MKAGKLRTLLTIEKRTDTSDGMGGVTVVWSTQTTVYGRQLFNARDWQARVEVVADQSSSIQRCRFETRFATGITPLMRIKTPDSRYFEIEAVYDPSGKRERLEIVAKELQNAGV